MAFTITLSFIREHDQELFLERVAPRLRGHLVDPPADEVADAEGYHRVALSVTSPSAAREVCQHAFGFLAHAKNARIIFSWAGADGQVHYGDLNAGQGRDAELLAMRVGAAAKACLDAEREAAEGASAEAPEESSETEA
jgi:hypothetical protein